MKCPQSILTYQNSQ